MSDPSYNTKVHLKQGGEEQVIGAGGTLTIEDTATVSVDGDDYTGAEFKALLALLADVPTQDPGDSETIWNDSGVLKVAGSGGG